MKNYISASKTLENHMTVLKNFEKNSRIEKDILSYISKIFPYILRIFFSWSLYLVLSYYVISFAFKEAAVNVSSSIRIKLESDVFVCVQFYEWFRRSPVGLERIAENWSNVSNGNCAAKLVFFSSGRPPVINDQLINLFLLIN